MPFKIVNTIEKGKSVLTAVPSHWEKQGSLFWPRGLSTKIEKLRRLENCMPEAGWITYNCILKRKDLCSFKRAEEEIEKMCPHSDTETDTEKEIVLGRKTYNFKDIVRECLNDADATYQEAEVASTQEPLVVATHEEVPGASEPIVVPGVTEPLVLSVASEPLVVSSYEESVPSEVLSVSQVIENLTAKITAIEDNQTILQQNINVVLENQKMIFESQQHIILNLSKSITQFEEYMKKSSRPTKNYENVDFKLIQDHEQLQCFELSLKHSEKEVEYKKILSTVCGKGKGRGINNAYTLIDAMFDRNFLKTCSWAGGSRTTEAKICFKSFNETIKFFFELVHDSDNSFTLNECHIFFKNILKNSAQRCISKKLRTSATKNRPKKIKTINTSAISADTVQPFPLQDVTNNDASSNVNVDIEVFV